jgi:hypothetical protein
MSVSPTPASQRGRSLLGLVAPALWVAAFLLAPGRACAQFRLFDLGVGTDYISELQKSLTISSSLGTVTIFDPQDGSTVTGPLNGDPRLLNRKFDIEWQMSGPGVRLPFTLSTPHVIGGAAIRPTLTLEALEGDFDLRFLNQRESSPNDALHGRGPMYGAELALRAESGNWFAETGYRYHSLPSTSADRSQPFTSPGAEVLTDESRLSRETHDAFTRVGYSLSPVLFTYTGIRYRKANVEVEDNLRFVDALQRETTLSSRTKLNSSVTEAIVGMEARKGRFVGRTEITFGEQDYGVLATVVYAGQPASPPPPPQPTVPAAVLLTLRLFWNLANLQVRNPSIIPLLLSTNPREPARTLASLEINFTKYQEQLAEKARVRPIVLFVNHGTDPGEEARRRNLSVAPWPSQAPPALLSGPELDTLILFEPLSSDHRESGVKGAMIRTQIASLAGSVDFSLAQNPAEADQSYDPLDLNPHAYKAFPNQWTESKKEVTHTRCRSRDAVAVSRSIITLLIYEEGGPDLLPTKLSPNKWEDPCPLSSGGVGVVVTQPGRKTPGKLIIAATIFLDPDPSPYQSQPVNVP